MPFTILHYFKSPKARGKVGSPQPFSSTTANHDRHVTPGLLRLPPEILLMISALLTGYHDLNSLILTHSRLASVLSSERYRRTIRNYGCANGLAYLLHSAVTKGAHSFMQILLTSYGIDPNTVGWMDETLLYRAVSMSDITSARMLLEAGINVNATNKINPRFTTTALHLASSRGHVGMISLLASHGANLEAVDSFGRTPLHSALCCICHESRIAAVSALLRSGASPNALLVYTPGIAWSFLRDLATKEVAWSPLHSAAVAGPTSQPITTRLIRLLAEYGADLEQPLLNIDPPCTPLALVAEFLVWFHLKQPQATRRVWFPSNHADNTIQSLPREYNAHWKVVELLLELGADIEPALLAMNQRPNLAPASERSNKWNQHPIFWYLSAPSHRMGVYTCDYPDAPLIPEDRWQMAGEYVKKGLERARDRVRRRANIR